VANLKGVSRRIAVVVSRYNSEITGKLLDGCLEALGEGGVAVDAIDVAYVPGAVELPLVCQSFAANRDYAVVVALGCVIRGETAHFDYVCSMVSEGVLRVSLETSTPVIFGVLTTEDLGQAAGRAGSGYANKGYESGLAALEMVSLMDLISRGRG